MQFRNRDSQAKAKDLAAPSGNETISQYDGSRRSPETAAESGDHCLATSFGARRVNRVEPTAQKKRTAPNRRQSLQIMIFPSAIPDLSHAKAV